MAHDGVRNAVVKARMEAMSAIGVETKTLGDMAKGAVPFNAKSARAAARSIADGAQLSLQLFRARETDPLSEGREKIWTDFGAFAERNADLVRVAERAAGSIREPGDLNGALRAIGSACRSCHKEFRK